MFGTLHANLVVDNSVFDGCYSTVMQGGGLYLDADNDGAVVSNTNFTNCVSPVYGGGLYSVFTSSITDMQLTSLHFANCTADRGGGAYLGEGVTGLKLVDSEFIGCRSTDGGGGLYITGCDDATIQRTTFSGCSSTSGGGMYVDTACADMHILESTFDSNFADQGAGATFFGDNSRVVVAGSTFSANEASGNGGGVFVTSEHENFLVTDMNTFAGLQTLETEHPYEAESYDTVTSTRDVIYSSTMTIYGATELLLVFDLQTVFRNSLSIYDNSVDRNLLYKSNGAGIAGLCD
jgi:hypothetical protein